VKRCALLLALAAGCNGAPPATLDDGLPTTCDPLRVPGACMMPWPNAIYLASDATTATGFRLALAPETLPPRSTDGEPFDPTRWNVADGFSPAGPILYYFAEPIDPSSLVPETDTGRSVAPGAATVIVDMTTNQLVAHFSGVDANVVKEFDRQGLIITPAQRLAPKRRYAVAITKAIRTTSGALPTPPPLFDRIANGDPPDDALSKAEAARMPDVLASLAAAGVSRDDLLVAWDFVTGSDEAITSHVLSMRDQALAAAGPTGIGYTVTSVEDDFDAATLRRVRGTFTAPAFLDNEDETQPEASLSFDASGAPVMNGTYEAPFTVIVPRAAQSGPLPILLVGHGLFNTGEIELGDATGSDIQDLANTNGYVVVATDWIGLSAHENPLAPNANGAFEYVLSDFSHLSWVTDRLQQALVTTMVLVRTMTGKIAADASLAGYVDTSKVTYYGNSLGGIMGMSFMGYDPDVTRGALGVGGGFWSTLFQRSVNWKEALLVFPGEYPDSLDQQLLMALAQMQFDYSDPATVAPYVVNAPLGGNPKKQVVMMMGVGDAQVPNVATEMIARTAGTPLLSPNAIDVYGMTPQAGPLSSALTTWNVNSPPAPPDTNQTPAHDNQVHQAVRRLPEEMQMVGTFFSTGQVVDTCGGPCNLPVPPGTPPPDI